MIWPVRHLCTLTFACVLMATNGALADDKRSAMPSFTTPTVTEEFLRDLNHDQLRLLRRATKNCRSIGRAMRAERNPCVTTATDKAVADKGDPDLLAFHRALPVTERYDENRSSNVWRVWLTRR